MQIDRPVRGRFGQIVQVIRLPGLQLAEEPEDHRIAVLHAAVGCRAVGIRCFGLRKRRVLPSLSQPGQADGRKAERLRPAVSAVRPKWDGEHAALRIDGLLSAPGIPKRRMRRIRVQLRQIALPRRTGHVPAMYLQIGLQFALRQRRKLVKA